MTPFFVTTCRLILGIDVLRRLEYRLHDEFGRTAAGDAVERRTDAASFAIDGVALGALGLALGIEEDVLARLGISRQIRLPGVPAGARCQAADEEYDLGDLLLLQGVAEFLHGGFGDAVLDDADDVLVRVAVGELLAGQVGALAAAARAAVTAAAQAAE